MTSRSAFDSGCAQPNSPLTLRVGDGQRLNVSIYNFNGIDDVNRGSGVTVVDPVSSASVDVNMGVRHQFLMTSLSNEVHVTFKDERSHVALEISGTKCVKFIVIHNSNV